MTSLAEAFRILMTSAEPLAAEWVPLAAARGRVAAGDLLAPRDVPDFPRVMMDGYACRAADLAAAGPGRPVRLRITGRRWAGPVPTGEGRAPGPEGGPGDGRRPRAAIGPASGEAWQVSTGAVLPDGADVVVPLEHARVSGDVVEIQTPFPAGRNVAPPGEDVERGQPLVRAGERITGAAAGVLAATGVLRVPVVRRPRVLILATGDELVPLPGGEGAQAFPGDGAAACPGQLLRVAPPPNRGRLFNSNAVALASELAALGLEVVDGGIVPDDPPTLRRAFAQALDGEYDVLLTTGGVSVGVRDGVPRAWMDLGVRRRVGWVHVRPGGPFFAGRAQDKWVIALSGSPASCWAAFQVLVRPFLLRLAGLRRPVRPVVEARLASPWPKGGGKPRLIWARLTGDAPPYGAHPLAGARGRLAQIAHSQALLFWPHIETVPAPGTAIGALRLDLPEDREWLGWFAAPATAPPSVASPSAATPASISGPSGSPPAGWAGSGERAEPAAAGAGTAQPFSLEKDRPQPHADPAAPSQAASAAPDGEARVLAVAVTGRSGAGKTWVASRLVRHLRRRGLEVVAVKHAAHGFQLDRQGSDSQRLAEAGAAGVLLLGPGEVAWRVSPPTPLGLPPELPGEPAVKAPQSAPGDEPSDPGRAEIPAPGGPVGATARAAGEWVRRVALAYRALTHRCPDLVLVEGATGRGLPEIVVGEPKRPPAGETLARLPERCAEADVEAVADRVYRLWAAHHSAAPAKPRWAPSGHRPKP